jgi:hypothetical protein
MKALAGRPVPIGWRFSNKMQRGCQQYNKPLSKDRTTPKVATNIDKIFCATELLLKVKIVVAIPMNAVPMVQMRETFHTYKVYNQPNLI